MPTHVFTYGSLMFDAVWSRIVLGRYASCAAWLSGYERFMVQGETYPGVIDTPGGVVQGVLYLDVSDADLARLDRFEGEDYERRTVQVAADGGAPLCAEVYVYRDPARLARVGWEPDWFVRDDLDRFLATYGGWR